MPSLSRDNRKLLENTVVAARSIAERGAEKSLISLGVGQRDAPDSLTPQERILRNQLRAHGRHLGDSRHQSGVQETRHLMQAVAYEHWHRMLFARFLADNDLLMHPEYGIAMSMDEVQEAAREQGIDWLTLAMDCAQHMLIEVFRADDPVLRAVLPPETRLELEQKLEQLPIEAFTAEDSLGWVYQFWQRDEKERVNASEVKIGADELAPVTQLFTEDYMVLFLLHNTLGAWWTAKRRAEGRGNDLPGHEWTYLHLNEDGSPSAGDFDGWPRQLSELRILDPCMGSGHFLAFALPILVKMAEVEYALTPGEAVHSVLIQNLFGLELDARCSQIAAFNLALTAWRAIGRYVPLPPMNLACSGLRITSSEDAWVAIASNCDAAGQAMKKLYCLFSRAPVLGSLIDPTGLTRDLFTAEFETVRELLISALGAEGSGPEQKELAIAARGVIEAARILSMKFALVCTNVPYLGRGKQDSDLSEYCDQTFPEARADLATCFLVRCLRFCDTGGSTALVTPQNWLFSGTYTGFRRMLLESEEWNLVARLGERAFDSGSAAGAFAALSCLTRRRPPQNYTFPSWDVGTMKSPPEKAAALLTPPEQLIQGAQTKNPNAVIVSGSPERTTLLSDYAKSVEGISTGDSHRFVVFFWELTWPNIRWEVLQGPPANGCAYAGLEMFFCWDSGCGDLAVSEAARIRGHSAWGRPGVVVGQMRNLRCSLSLGVKHDKITAVIVPADPEHLPAIWAYCSSAEYNKDVRTMTPRINASTGSLVQVPFDLERWSQAAREATPSGLPSPHSYDPSQCLFKGDPRGSFQPLQVAVARLVGYRWPRQCGMGLPDCPATEPDGLEAYVDEDGILGLNSIGGEEPAAYKLRRLLAQAYGDEWSVRMLAELIGGARSLEDWLRDEFFEQHCAVFHDRPFVWHVWDGRRDGFHALVNYHKLAGPNGEGKRTLEKLIYSLLGDWIGRQRAEVATGTDGAEARLIAALHLQSELEKILVGEPPYDIFVRWKPLYQQPIGWEPDLDDGVRLNIRPWLHAKPYQPPKRDTCILRVTPIKLPFGKDRGKEPARDKENSPWFAESQDRTNDIHLTLDEKRKARERKEP